MAEGAGPDWREGKAQFPPGSPHKRGTHGVNQKWLTVLLSFRILSVVLHPLYSGLFRYLAIVLVAFTIERIPLVGRSPRIRLQYCGIPPPYTPGRPQENGSWSGQHNEIGQRGSHTAGPSFL